MIRVLAHGEVHDLWVGTRPPLNDLHFLAGLNVFYVDANPLLGVRRDRSIGCAALEPISQSLLRGRAEWTEFRTAGNA